MTEAARQLSLEQSPLRSLNRHPGMASLHLRPLPPTRFDDVHQALEAMHTLHQDLAERIARLEAAFDSQGDEFDGWDATPTDIYSPSSDNMAKLPPPAQEDARPPAPEPQRPYKVEQGLDSTSPQHELKNRFIYDLLHGRIQDEATILRDAKILGMDFAPPRTVILIDAAAYILAADEALPGETVDVQIRRRAQTIIRSVVNFFYLPNETICAYLGDGEVAVLKASDTKNLVNWADQWEVRDRAGSPWANLPALRRAGNALLQHLRSANSTAVSVGIGRYHPGITELARSYQDARAALSLGRRFCGQNGVYSLDNLGIAAFVGVSDERTKVDLATHLLSPLDGEAELLDTLDAFFAENCCPSTTAARLTIHRNTLSYRLDKVTALIGLNPRRFDDGVQIRLALALRSLSSDHA